MKSPRFLTTGKNLKEFSAHSGGDCIHLPTSFTKLLLQSLRQHGWKWSCAVLAGRSADVDVGFFAERNLLRRRIRWPRIFRSSIVSQLYLSYTILHARILWAAFEDAFAKYPSAAVLIHNGFLVPHSILAAVAKKAGRPHCFLEGGFFPNTFQCDRLGINFDSSLPRSPDFYRNLELLPNETTLPDTLVTRKTKIKDGGIAEFPEGFIFVPFQVPSDMQILALSPWIRDMQHLYSVVVKLANRFPNRNFVIKEHPSFPLSIRTEVEAHPRVIFANQESTQKLIERSEAVITINSTVGLEAMLLQKKIITLGEAHYDIEGLVLRARNDDALAAAFERLGQWTFDVELRQKFLAYVYNIFLIHGNVTKPSTQTIDAIQARMIGADRHSVLINGPDALG